MPPPANNPAEISRTSAHPESSLETSSTSLSNQPTLLPQHRETVSDGVLTCVPGDSHSPRPQNRNRNCFGRAGIAGLSRHLSFFSHSRRWPKRTRHTCVRPRNTDTPAQHDPYPEIHERLT
jgi:hypothetical protein